MSAPVRAEPGWGAFIDSDDEAGDLPGKLPDERGRR